MQGVDLKRYYLANETQPTATAAAAAAGNGTGTAAGTGAAGTGTGSATGTDSSAANGIASGGDDAADTNKLPPPKSTKKQPKKHKLLVYSVDVPMAHKKSNKAYHDDTLSTTFTPTSTYPAIPTSTSTTAPTPPSTTTTTSPSIPMTRRLVVNRETLNACGWNKFYQRYLTVPPGTYIYPHNI